MINRQDSRHRIKRSNLTGVVPTAHTASTDFTDGTWLNTDLREAEFFYNIPDKKLWIGTGTSSIEIAQIGSTTSGNSLAQTLAIGNDSGTSDILIGTATFIKSTNGNFQIEPDVSGNPFRHSISNGNGTELFWNGDYLSINSLNSGISVYGAVDTSITAGPMNESFIYLDDSSISLSTNTNTENLLIGAGKITQKATTIRLNAGYSPLATISIPTTPGNLYLSAGTGSIYMASDAFMAAGTSIIQSGNTSSNFSSSFGGSFTYSYVANDNIIMGNSNIVYGSESIVSGRYNTLGASFSEGIMISNSSNIVSGQGNIVSNCTFNIVSGANNILSGQGNILSGQGNTVSGRWNIVSGASCTVSGGSNIVVSEDYINTVNGSTLNGYSNILSGGSNNIYGNYNIISGFNNSLIANNSSILGGSGIVATQSNTVYVPDLYIQDSKSISFNNNTTFKNTNYGWLNIFDIKSAVTTATASIQLTTGNITKIISTVQGASSATTQEISENGGLKMSHTNGSNSGTTYQKIGAVSTTTIGTFSMATINFMANDQSFSITGHANGYCASPNRNMGSTFYASFIKYGGTIYQNGTTDIVLKDGYGDGTTPKVWTDGANIYISIRTFSALTSKFTTSYEILQ